MVSGSGGPALLCLAVCVAIFTRRRWVRVLCTAYLALATTWLAIDVARGRVGPAALALPAILLVFGLYVHGVYRGLGDGRDEGP